MWVGLGAQSRGLTGSPRGLGSGGAGAAPASPALVLTLVWEEESDPPGSAGVCPSGLRWAGGPAQAALICVNNNGSVPETRRRQQLWKPQARLSPVSGYETLLCQTNLLLLFL